MRPHVDLLPAATPINLNTASREVLAAVLGSGRRRRPRSASSRPANAIRSTASPRRRLLLGEGVALDDRRVGVASNYFDVRGRLRLDERVLEERSLVSRMRREVTLLDRERVNRLQ